jgi:hypothetical protein
VFQVYNSHSESLTSRVDDKASYLAIADDKTFSTIFDTYVVMGGKYVTADTLKSSIVLAVIKHDKGLKWNFSPIKATEDNGTLYVQYTASSKEFDDSIYK